MQKNYALWIVGAIVVIGIGYVLMQGGTPSAGTPAPGVTDTTAGGATETTPRSGAKPIVTTIGFASVSTTTAVVVGTVIPGGVQTTYWFEYGPTPSLGFKEETESASASWKQLGAAAYITGLKPGTQYYFRLGAKNAYGTVYGAPYNFITEAK